MPRAKSMLTGALALALLTGLWWTSREAGKRMARAGWWQGDPKSARKIAVAPNRPGATENPGQTLEALQNTIRRLEFLAAGSAYLPGDWETLAEVQAILDGLSAEDLAQIHAAIHGGPFGSALHYLTHQVLAAWVRPPRGNGQGIFAVWAQEDPSRALDWLESAELSGELAGKKDELRAAALGLLLQRDFERATAEFLKLPPTTDAQRDERASLMGNWASQTLGDPALRERLIDFAKSTGHPADHASLNDRLFREWPQDDALGLLTYLQDLREYQETADIPADQRPAIDATAVGAAIYREYDRPALEWWMERYEDRTEVPAPLHDAMVQWHFKYPDKLTQWFAEQPPSPQRDAMQAALLPAQAVGNPAAAAQAIGNITDPDLRQSAIERLDYSWSRKDAAAAAAWRATLSEADGTQ
jgi:hypothetical protein